MACLPSLIHAPLIVEAHNRATRQAHVGHDETDSREQLALRVLDLYLQRNLNYLILRDYTSEEATSCRHDCPKSEAASANRQWRPRSTRKNFRRLGPGGSALKRRVAACRSESSISLPQARTGGRWSQRPFLPFARLLCRTVGNLPGGSNRHVALSLSLKDQSPILCQQTWFKINSND